MAEHEGQPAGPRGLEDLEVGSAAGNPEETGHLGPEQAFDQEIGNGGHHAPPAATRTDRATSRR